MRKYLIIVLSICLGNLYAQDVIIKRNGDELNAKIEEISQAEIKFKKFENLDGPSYVLPKSEVFIIKYSNGTKEVISSNDATPVQNNQYSQPTQTYSQPAPTFAQSQPNTPASLRIEGEGWRFYQEGRSLSESSLTRVLKEAKNEDALKELKEGRSLRSAGKVLNAVGIPLLVSGPIITLIGVAVISGYNSAVNSYNSGSGSLPDISGYNTGNTMMGIGYAMFGTGLSSVIAAGVINGSSKKKYLKATELYNAKL
jgi:hypothetical protein